MILEKDFKERETEIDGQVDERIEMGVDTDSINHLMMILSSNLYQNPIGSIVREYTSNAVDANMDAKCNEPVIVRLRKNVMGNWFFEVQDFGTGLDDADFRNIISKYGKSTKRDKVDQLGYFGLGCKSGFSYSDSFHYTCRKDGKERKYLLYKSETGFTIDLMFEQDTTEKNGVAVTIPVNESDYSNFRKEIRNQLAYFENVYFDVELKKATYGYYDHSNDTTEDLNKDFKIYKEKNFQYSSFSVIKELHLTLGRVNYPIDFKALAINPINVPVALKFELDCGIFPIPNRENLIWNKRTKEIVLAKLIEVSNWFTDRFNENVKKVGSLYEAWPYINVQEKKVLIGDKDMVVNQLLTMSSKPLKEVEIPSMILLSPQFYKSHLNDLIANLRLVAEYYNGTMRTKRLYFYQDYFFRGKNTIGIIGKDVTMSGYFREFLKTKGFRYFFKEVDTAKDDKYYEQMLGLSASMSKTLRDATIAEFKSFANQLTTEGTTDISNLHNSQEYEDYKNNNKAVAKSKGFIGLNKQKHQVTVAYAEKKKYGGHFFKKTAFDLDSLIKNKFLTVFVDDKVDATNITAIFAKQNVRFAEVGVQDMKKIQNLKLNNFMTQREMEKTKMFSRTATGIFAKRVLATFEELMRNRMGLVTVAVSGVRPLYDKVTKYVTANASNESCSAAMEASILTVAETNNLWDLSAIADIRKLDTCLSDFKFITLLAPPKNQTDIEEYEKHITSILLFKKLKYEDRLPHYTLTNKK